MRRSNAHRELSSLLILPFVLALTSGYALFRFAQAKAVVGAANFMAAVIGWFFHRTTRHDTAGTPRTGRQPP
jgi:hypothetical protein